MSAIKRVERLLFQVEARATQAAAAAVKNESLNSRKRKFANMSGRAGAGADDAGAAGAEVGGIVEVAARLAENEAEMARRGEVQEEVVVKATGRAVQKALAVGVWFLKKEGLTFQLYMVIFLRLCKPILR